ncbi:hypothetical protein Y032_0067g20 [Ancylostoma ceylanicum]|uniref:Uncharacterized protein n=1 Tax=Ancylostoma ceylanicum TaxID=53326 RepID=A0A016U000_9BILA|nr:hypothetical protein Y032_0067g20 [Ancylostoma ceylanicum]
MKALKRFFARICSRFKKKTEETENDTPEETEKETPKKHRQEETGSLSSKSQKSHRNVKLYSIRKNVRSFKADRLSRAIR